MSNSIVNGNSTNGEKPIETKIEPPKKIEQVIEKPKKTKKAKKPRKKLSDKQKKHLQKMRITKKVLKKTKKKISSKNNNKTNTWIIPMMTVIAVSVGGLIYLMPSQSVQFPSFLKSSPNIQDTEPEEKPKRGKRKTNRPKNKGTGVDLFRL